MMGKRKPALRFKGFEGEWEHRKLGEDIADIVGGGTPCTSNPTYWDGDIDWYSPTEIGDNIYANGSIKRITELGLKKSSAKMLPENRTILFTSRAGIGDMAILQRSGTTNQGFQSLVLREGYNPYFIYSAGFLIKKYALKNSSGSTFLEISGINLGKMTLSVPEFEEQIKIEAYFKHLDTLITQQQRKYDSLLNVKKSMLEKMFPKDGADVPEIRFKGFSEAWGQRTLGSIADKVTEKNLNQKYTETFTNSAEYGVVTQLDYFDHTISNVKNIWGYYVVRNDDFIYNPRVSSEAPVGPFNRNKLQRTGIMSPLYSVFRIHDIDHTFLEQYFKSSYWHSFMRLNGDNGARADRFSIKGDKFIEMPIPYPCLDEQNMIAEYLSEIDFLISLHHQKLDHLKHIKSALLEKMFVSEAA